MSASDGHRLPAQTDAAARIVLAAGLFTVTGYRPPRLDDEAASLLRTFRGRRRLLRRAEREQMLPMLERFLRGRADPTLTTRLRAFCRVFAAVSAKLFEHLEPIAAEGGRGGVPLMLLKGGDLVLSCYSPGLPRMMRDLDVLVRRRDVSAIVRVLTTHGFVQGQIDRRRGALRPLPAEALRELQAGHYELLPFSRLVRLSLRAHDAGQVRYLWHHYPFVLRRGEVVYRLDYDVHFNVSVEIDERDLWRDPRRLRLPGGAHVYAQAPSELFWFRATRLYYEALDHGQESIRALTDVMAILRAFANDIDWDRVHRVARKYAHERALSTVGAAVNRLCADAVPTRVVERWKSTRGPRGGDGEVDRFLAVVLGRRKPRAVADA